MNQQPTAIQLLLSYRNLAKDSFNHSIMIKDSMMLQFLAYSLDSPNYDELEHVLRIFELLVDDDKNLFALKSTAFVMDSLKTFCERKDVDEVHRQLGAFIYRRLSEAPSKYVIPRHILVDDGDHKAPSYNQYNFHVFGLNDDTKNDVESTIIRVKGVVSVVVDSRHQRCTVRTVSHVLPENLAETVLDQVGLECRLIVKNNKNQEVLKDVLKKRSPRKSINNREDVEIEDGVVKSEPLKEVESPQEDDGEEYEEHQDLPSYLPEEEEEPPVKEKALLSLDRLKTSAVSWVKTATSLWQSSYYW